MAQGGRKKLIAALLESRSRKTDEHAARFKPGVELFLRAGDELADIGEHDGRDLLGDELMHGGRDIALARRDDVGVGGERALDIIEGREQRLGRLPRFARDDADPVPLRARVEKVDGACRPLACDLDARHLIANLEREVEASRGLAGSLRDRECRLAQRLAAAGERLDHA